MSARTSIMRSPRLMGVVGTLVVVGLSLLVVVISVASFGQRTVIAVVEHTAGLRVGEEVQVAGVGVGEVRSIELTEDAVAVEFVIDDDIALGSTSTASVKVATLLGTHFLEITPSGTGELEGDTIPLARTSVPYNLQDVIEGTTDALDELDADQLAEAMAVVTEVLRETPDASQAAIEGVSALSEAAARRSDQFGELLRATHAVTGDLLDNTGSIFMLMEQSVLLLEHLNARREAIDAMLRDTRALAMEISGLLSDSEADLAPLMANLTVALDDLENSKDDIIAGMTDLSLMTKYVANAAGNGPWIDLHVPVAIPDNLTCLAKPGECE